MAYSISGKCCKNEVIKFIQKTSRVFPLVADVKIRLFYVWQNMNTRNKELILKFSSCFLWILIRPFITFCVVNCPFRQDRFIEEIVAQWNQYHKSQWEIDQPVCFITLFGFTNPSPSATDVCFIKKMYIKEISIAILLKATTWGHNNLPRLVALIISLPRHFSLWNLISEAKHVRGAWLLSF